MNNIQEFYNLALAAEKAGVLKKVVLSKLSDKSLLRIYGEAREKDGSRLFVLFHEYHDGKKTQKNYPGVPDVLHGLLDGCSQANLITSLGDCEYRCNKNGSVINGAAKFNNKLSKGTTAKAEIKPLEHEKNYILCGSEQFLTELGISDKSGRVHDKKQSKFRQINRFLEYVSDITRFLPESGEIIIYDLCCGKSYLSFAVYYYFTRILSRQVTMLGMDLKADVMKLCAETAKKLGFDTLDFIAGDIRAFLPEKKPHLVMSLHACDIATDIVLEKAIDLSADVILSTPCCHRRLSLQLDCPELDFVGRFPILKSKMCDALTDAMRLSGLEAAGYNVAAFELIDPNDTPKNVLLRAIRNKSFDPNSASALKLSEKYKSVKSFLLGTNQY